MDYLKTIAVIALGGSIGSISRYYVSLWAAQKFGAHFPYGTLFVNIAGCFIIGCFMVMATERLALSPYWRLLVATGFLGGLTTFSSFGYETLKLLEEAQVSLAIYNVIFNVIAGLAATWLGMTIARIF